jgi:hypothetical protein
LPEEKPKISRHLKAFSHDQDKLKIQARSTPINAKAPHSPKAVASVDSYQAIPLRREDTTTMARQLLPLVSLAALHELEASLDGEATLCRSFVSSYVSMWPPRYERLCGAMAEQDSAAAMDAALSLCTSSYMVGAQRLGHLTDELIAILHSGVPASAMQALPRLRRCGEQTVCELVSRYICPEHCT